MGNPLTKAVGNILTTLMGNVLTEQVGKVLDIYISPRKRDGWDEGKFSLTKRYFLKLATHIPQ